jgi:Carboxyl transferase domain
MVEPDSSEGWDGVVEQLAGRRDAARAMGGEERLRKHRDGGKLDARARIAYLLDPGSFQELGTLVGGEEAPADAVVMGSGRVDGRPVMVAAEDFTVKAAGHAVAVSDVRTPGSGMSNDTVLFRVDGEALVARRPPARRPALVRGVRRPCASGSSSPG